MRGIYHVNYLSKLKLLLFFYHLIYNILRAVIHALYVLVLRKGKMK